VESSGARPPEIPTGWECPADTNSIVIDGGRITARMAVTKFVDANSANRASFVRRNPSTSEGSIKKYARR